MPSASKVAEACDLRGALEPEADSRAEVIVGLFFYEVRTENAGPTHQLGTSPADIDTSCCRVLCVGMFDVRFFVVFVLPFGLASFALRAGRQGRVKFPSAC